MLTCACGTFRDGQITRTLAGESRPGIFVSPFSYEHFIRAELAEVRGDLRRAAEEYRLARAGPEDDALLIARLADVLDRLGDEDEAIALLAQGDELSDDAAGAELIWLARGRIHRRHGRLDAAVDALAHAASAAPTSEAGPLALAEVLRDRGEDAQADAILERYLTRSRGAGAARARLALALERRDPLAAADSVRSLLEAAPARREEVRAAARIAIDQAQPELALRLLAALPDAPEDRSLRLRARIAAHDPEGAEALLARWMPVGAEELLEVADGYLEIGHADRALELAQVAARSGGGPNATLLLGRAHRAVGRPARAASLLAQIEPGSRAWPAAPIELALALRDLGRGAMAAEVLAYAQRRAGDEAIQLALSESRWEAGDAQGALAALEGDGVRLAAARARLLDRMGRPDAATRAYAELPDDPALPTSPRVRAQAERATRAGDRERAIQLLRDHTMLAPEDEFTAARLRQLERTPAS